MGWEPWEVSPVEWRSPVQKQRTHGLVAWSALCPQCHGPCSVSKGRKGFTGRGPSTLEMGFQTSAGLPTALQGVVWPWGPALPFLTAGSVSPLQLAEGVWAALARCLSPPVTAAPAGRGPLEPSRGT